MKSLVWAFVLFLSLATAVSADNGGYALKFNGTDGYAAATMNTGNTNSTMTMEFWFAQVTSQAGTQYLADLHSISGTNNRRVMPYLNNGIIGVFCAPNTGNDNNAVTQSTGITVSPNVWYHVAVTINDTTLKMYVNGKLFITTSLTDSYALTGTEVLTLATDYGNTTYANIKMDEVRIWSSERTEAQIKANMYKELAGSEAGLLSYYRMSNGSGAALSDNQTAGTYGGTLSGGYTWVASGAFADNRNGLAFDGSNEYVDCGNGASVQRNGTQSFTLEAWVKPSGGVWAAVVSKFVHAATQEGYSLEIFSDNKVALLYGNNWNDWAYPTTTTSLTSGVWSHIAATYDGSTAKIYINGNLSQSAAWTNGVTDSGTNLLIGSRSGTVFYWGQLDEVRVWTVARTAAQLRETMTKTLNGNEAGLAAYYRLDQIDGSIAYDLTSNANNGTLTNMDPNTDWVTSDAFDTWIGAENAGWSNGGNWSKGAAPTSANSVGIYKWALGNEATVSGSPTVNNLFISATAAPTLSSAVTVNGNLVLEKNLDLDGQAVTLSSTSFLVEGSGRAFGASGTIATTRTLSNIFAQDVAGLGANITTAANLGSTTITRGHAQQTGGGNVSILRYYDIAPANNSSLDASLVFNYRDEELNGLTENNFRLYRSTDGGANWSDQGGTLSAVNNTVTKTGIASFSRWTVADSSLPLRITPTITFDAAPTPTYLGGNFTVSASTTNTDSSVLTYSRVSGPCAWVSGATFSSTGAGACVVQADGAATPYFNSASNTQSITIGKATPAIVFSAAPTPAYLGGNFTVGASTTNTDSAALTYSYVSGPCAWVSGATFGSTGAGVCVVQASGAATTNFYAASNTQSITIDKATPTITFGAAPAPTYLGGNFTASASTTNTDSTALTYSYVSGPCAWVTGSTFSSTGAGTCVVRADGAATTNFSAASQTQSIAIGMAGTTTTITSDNPAPSAVGQAVTVVYNVAANPPGGTPTGNVTVSDGVDGCTGTVAAGSCSLSLTTPGTRTLTATYAGDANFTGSSTTASHTVLNLYQLTVTRSGSGAVVGNVTGVEGNGINCGPDCTEIFSQGTVVTLAASPAAGWLFDGWSGACSGSGSCSVTMDAAKSVKAAFREDTFRVTGGITAMAYEPITQSVPSLIVEETYPIGIGPYAAAKDRISLNTGMKGFSEPTDLYFILRVPSTQPEGYYLLNSDNTFTRLSEGMTTWKAGRTEALDENLFGIISSGDLPSGTYELYMMAAPTGKTDTYHIWETAFDIPFSGEMPLPKDGTWIVHQPGAFPARSTDPAMSNPVGFGSVAVDAKAMGLSAYASMGDSVELKIGLEGFDGPADIYFGIYMPDYEPNDMYILRQDGVVRKLSEGLAAWKPGHVGPVEQQFGSILVSSLPKGRYVIYLLATPQGRMDTWYMWESQITIP